MKSMDRQADVALRGNQLRSHEAKHPPTSLSMRSKAGRSAEHKYRPDRLLELKLAILYPSIGYLQRCVVRSNLDSRLGGITTSLDSGDGCYLKRDCAQLSSELHTAQGIR
ncbi:hypothetical protein F442_18979 [Phytophthora nicotianae P10297]|uniref:Uncharacterized protein n=2 Tax=Phytophthora nicotianae TaxID=4792 RepID=W2YAY6_PHYNI|nr:hypothetical protein L917_18351 [Phytophthora nicotianae]ETP32205.1 hypothetical protein F442_18979 [Phytophthora nicotianae P10297]